MTEENKLKFGNRVRVLINRVEQDEREKWMEVLEGVVVAETNAFVRVWCDKKRPETYETTPENAEFFPRQAKRIKVVKI